MAGAHTSQIASGVVVQGVTKRLRGKILLDRVSVSFPAAAISGLQGPNGSGKTMLLRAIAGLISVDEGTIDVLGERITGTTSFPSSMGFLIEPLSLWDEFTGRENLDMLAALSRGSDPAAPVRALERVGLDPNDGRPLRSYSLGMRQRLSIAQAIMGSPRLLLLDEPTNALDDAGKALIREILRAERDRGATILLVSHDLDELERLADRRFQMHEGRIKEMGEG